MKHIQIENLSTVQQIAPVYIVEIDHGALGTSLSGDRSYSRKQIVEDIATGCGKVVAVFEADQINGKWTDVSKDIAADVADSLYASREPVSRDLADWLQHHLGVAATNTLNHPWRTA